MTYVLAPGTSSILTARTRSAITSASGGPDAAVRL
jgi:hypothetical protein